MKTQAIASTALHAASRRALGGQSAISGLALRRPGFHFEIDPTSQGDQAEPDLGRKQSQGDDAGQRKPQAQDSELQKAIWARDRAKLKHRELLSAVASMLEIQDPKIPTGPNGVPQVDQLRSALATKVKAARDRRTAALERHVGELSVVVPLRAALAAEGAIDPEGDGSFSDLVELLLPRTKVEVAASDDDEDELEVRVTPLESDGTPMLVDGQPATIRDLVKRFLDKRPNYKRANFMRGPGEPKRLRGNVPCTQPKGDYQSIVASRHLDSLGGFRARTG